jgi:putative hemolysin
MDISALGIEILVLCIAGAAFFSAAETALTSLSEGKTKQLIENKGPGSKALHIWLHFPNRVLTTLLVGNTIANTLSAALVTQMTEMVFGNYSVAVATGFVTLLLLIFGEVTPKTFARHNAEKIAPIMMTLLYPIYWILWPVVMAVSSVAAMIVRLSGSKAVGGGPVATEEDIEFMVRLGQQEGVLEKEQGQMLESVFEFRDTLVKEAMVPRTEMNSIDKAAPVDSIMQLIREHGHTRWPVYTDNVDNIVGVFHTKDLLAALLRNREDIKIDDYLRPALFVPDVMKIGDLLKEFKHGRAHLAIVVDEYGGTAGMITLEDVIEELVGEIRDEYDSEEDERVLHKIDEDNYSVDGKASIHNLGEVLGIEFPEDEDFESLAGFLIATYGKMPPLNAEIDFCGWRFMVKKADEKRIETVLIRRIIGDSQSEDTKRSEHS